MSKINYDLVIKNIYRSASLIDEEEVNDDAIKYCESKLGVFFSPQHYDFLKKHSNLEFDGYSFYGVNNHYTKSKNILVKTILERSENLAPFYIPFCKLDDDQSAYLDYSQLNKDMEPTIILLEHISNELIDYLASDIGEFLNLLINNELQI